MIEVVEVFIRAAAIPITDMVVQVFPRVDILVYLMIIPMTAQVFGIWSHKSKVEEVADTRTHT